MEMRFEYTDEDRAEAKRRSEEWAAEREASSSARTADAARAWPGGVWLPMETCPFAALKDAYDEDGVMWVTDGVSVALARVKERFGTPVRWKVRPTLVVTPRGMRMEGGVEEPIVAPTWWFDWELEDMMTERGDYGRDEIGFIPTHYLPAPLPPAR